MSRGLVLTLLLTLVLTLVSLACTPEEEYGPQSNQQRPPPRETVRLDQQELATAELVIEPAVRGTFRDYLDFPGTVGPNEHAIAEVNSLIRGRILEVYADLGDDVEAGAHLALLYSKDLGMAQSGYLRAQAQLYVAERAHARAQALLEGKVIGRAEAQRREGDMVRARAEVRETRDRLELMGMSEQEIRQLDRQQKIISRVPIVAPFRGRVIARDVTRGEVVEVTERLFVVADLAEVWVQVQVPEKDVPAIPREQSPEAHQVEITVTSYPDTIFRGRITYVSDVLDPATRTVPVRLEVPNPDGRLKPGMFARIRVYAPPQPDALLIPVSAIQRDRERRFVFVRRDADTFEPRDVELGASDGKVVTVLGGLREGEPVVVKGGFILKSELFSDQI